MGAFLRITSCSTGRRRKDGRVRWQRGALAPHVSDPVHLWKCVKILLQNAFDAFLDEMISALEWRFAQLLGSLRAIQF